MDVFGVALHRAILAHDDIHRLVAADLAEANHGLVGRDLGQVYLSLRLEAEERARAEASSEGRHEVASANIADHLQDLVASTGLVDDPSDLVRRAITIELDLYQELSRANPEALWLHDLAVERDMQIAFVADSHLPRDLIARLIQGAQFRPDFLVVSSHEGLTKKTGLFNRLARLCKVEPSAITHLGPDADLDVTIPATVGMRTFHYPSGPDRNSCSLIADDRSQRSGLDSIALGLASSRLDSIDPATATPADIGYYAGGPLAAGFATWIGQIIADQCPTRVLFCGPAGQLVCHVTAFVNDQLSDGLLTVLPPPRDGYCPVTDLTDLGALIDVEDGDRVLVVDLGWTGMTHLLVDVALQAAEKTVEVTGAYLGLTNASPPAPGVLTWAVQLPETNTDDRSCPPHLLQALLAGVPPAPTAADIVGAASDDEPGETTGRRLGLGYKALRYQIEAGVREFIAELEPWLTFSRDRGTRTLIEPAHRIMTNPTHAEASVLGTYPLGTEPDGSPTLLATLPPLAQIAQDPSLIDTNAADSPWAAGYMALAAGTGHQTSSPIARRSKRLRRRDPGLDGGAEEAC
ncbi:MAG: hypothetical protein GY939_19485 [Actinomycetia bacterium]|nr:hypothetical protein [Actinomycetes bacterium]